MSRLNAFQRIRSCTSLISPPRPTRYRRDPPRHGGRIDPEEGYPDIVVVVEDLWTAAYSISIRKRIICLLFKCRSYDVSIEDPLWSFNYDDCECFPTIARWNLCKFYRERKKERKLLFLLICREKFNTSTISFRYYYLYL